MLFNRVLITGANGLLGQALVRRLSQNREYDVLATARDDAPRFEDASCGYAPLDVTQPDDVAQIFEDFTPNVVVNCAAMSDVAECDEQRSEAWAVNARAVKTLAKHCRTTGARLVQVSTDFVFNGKRGPYDEGARPDPVNYYGRTKLAGENAVREAGRANWAIVRTVLLYGTGRDLRRSNIVLWVADQLSQGESLHIVNDQHRTPTHVDDLADGIEQLLHREATGLYHVSGADMVSIYELACAVATGFGLDASLIEPVSSDFFEDAVERPLRTGFVVDKARDELDYAPRPLDDGLRAVQQALQGFSPS
ncbi:dTDP-4-dehydrorhamnose reductase [Salinibacter altiplanensis]|uniref:dTDP-4-dehydrorhamnose reductase n=1 Tax=Salinibacter altiplanensis TaxID=1803181 RepID=UPI000C9FF11F|nr:dTDP-4-dehydrorhamnose reductase [Salinibacter altiplanensis]